MKYKDSMKIEFYSTTQNDNWVCSAIEIFLRRFDVIEQELEDIKIAVHEAIENAVIHAYDYNKGKITITVGVINDNIIEVEVKDKGVGIADVNKAMETFYTTAEEKGCVGIGFTIMENFMTSIKVASIPKKGTTVLMKKEIDAL